MMNIKFKNDSLSYTILQMTLLAIIFGAIFLVVEPFIDIYLLKKNISLFDYMFKPDNDTLLERSFLTVLFLIFGIIASVKGHRHKETLKALYEEKMKAREYLNIIGSVIMIIGSDQKVKLINKKGCAILEHDESGILGKNWFDTFLPHESTDTAKNAFDKLMLGGINSSDYYECPIVARSGEKRIIAWYSTILKDTEGHVYAALCSGEDITNRKSAEDIVQRNLETETAINILLKSSLEDVTIEDLLKITLNLILSVSWLSFENKGCIFLADEDSHTLVMKAAYGISADQKNSCSSLPFGKCLCGSTALSKIPQFADSSAECNVTTTPGHAHYCVPVLSSGKTLGVINMYIRDGCQKDEKDLAFLKAIANTLAGVIERKTVQNSLRHRIEMEQLLSSISTRFINVELSNIDTEINSALSKIGEYASFEHCHLFLYNSKTNKIQGSNCWSKKNTDLLPETISSPDINTFPWVFSKLQKFENIILTGIESLPAESMKDKESFSEFFIKINRSILFVPIIYKNALTGFLLLSSPKKHWISHDVALLRTLGEVFVSAMDRKRLESQFIQAQKMETIGRLAGGVAHDLNNLMTPILGYAQLGLNLIPKDNPVYGDMEEIYKAAERAANLTRQLLAFSRRQTLNLEIIDINDVLSDMEKMLNHLIGEDVELITTPALDCGHTRVDRGQVEQVITNMVINARDAMPQGGKIIIETSNLSLENELNETRAELPPGRYVLLSISDTGSGMTEDVKAHLFEPFFTTKEKGKGTGLGLATCYGIIKQTGGSIWVYSELGKGTCFKIYLPRVDEAIPVLKKCDTPQPHHQSEETILLVEDDGAVRMFAARILRESGYKVIEAQDGEQAISILEGEFGSSIQLLLTDAIMPKINGKDLARHARTLRPEIKIVFVSGYTNDILGKDETLPGDMPLLQKPFSQSELLKTVRTVLQ